MSAPPTDRLRFRWRWRPYQERVLGTVEMHLRDNRLHLVAAPGAGKTTLGLEIFRRLEKPGLVLTPTLTIRNQWLQRLRDFLPTDVSSADREWLRSWTSRELDDPGFLTVTTYQALLARSRGGAARGERGTPSGAAPSPTEVDALARDLRDVGVGTLILDEAHHLTREWWKALASLVGHLDDATLLSLTATPPYDATGHQWRRYEELCGPIDDEISVPELVQAGTLSPHQDLVYAVLPSEEVAAGVSAHDRAVATTLSDLIDDPDFQQEVDRHPWVRSDNVDVAAVLERPEVAVALLSYLRATGAGLPFALLDLLALAPDELPSLDRHSWERLLREYLYGPSFEADADYRRALTRRLRKEGLLWRRTLRLSRSPEVERSLALTASKTEACVRIHEHERKTRGHSLRQVVLTDFIRDEALGDAYSRPQDLGAFPVFDALAHSGEVYGHSDVGMVTGRLTIVHRSRIEALREALDPQADARFSEVPHRPGWVQVDGRSTGQLVGACTKLLTAGELRVLIGTRALLGEGWDAPVVNSLVLASYVGAFVTTNQMRGRAIRTDPGDPGKVATVWHIVAVAPEVPTGILDLDQLRTRFTTFVGISADATAIESGIARLDLPPLESALDLAEFNKVNLSRLDALDGVAVGWRTAIAAGEAGRVAPSVAFRKPPTLRPLHIRNTLGRVLLQGALAVVVALGETLRSALLGGGSALGTAVMVGGAIPFLVLTPRLFRSARLALMHAPVDGSVGQIGRALLEALREGGIVEGGELSVRTETLADGTVLASLSGGTFRDQSIFADALSEMLGPVENPRYLITRPASVFFRRRVDYHAVPEVLGRRRELAEAIHGAWRRYVGGGDLVYTRREGGRAILLAARARAFANQFVPAGERLDRWQ